MCHEGLFYVTDLFFFKSMFKLINIFFMKRKNCVDYISHFVLFRLCLYFGVGNTSGKYSPLGGLSGGTGNPLTFVIKLWILTRGFIWTLGFGKQSQHCQDSIGTSTQKTQLLLPTLHISIKKKKCKNWNFLQCDER